MGRCRLHSHMISRLTRTSVSRLDKHCFVHTLHNAASRTYVLGVCQLVTDHLQRGIRSDLSQLRTSSKRGVILQFDHQKYCQHPPHALKPPQLLAVSARDPLRRAIQDLTRPEGHIHRKHVLEVLPRPHGQHPPLLQICADRREPTANGTIRREAVSWYVLELNASIMIQRD